MAATVLEPTDRIVTREGMTGPTAFRPSLLLQETSTCTQRSLTGRPSCSTTMDGRISAPCRDRSADVAAKGLCPILTAFDLLYLDGHDLTGSEHALRRHILEDVLLRAGNEAILLSDEVEVEGYISRRRPARSGSKATSPNAGVSPIDPAGPATG